MVFRLIFLIKNECIILFFCIFAKNIIMISLIVCSRNSNIPSSLKNNIEETIGTSYELIVVDNSQRKYSIFSAYNEGVRLAKGDYLCFMHEDVLYRSNDWGKSLEAYFLQFDSVGMVGVAGTHFLPAMPAAWWDTEIRSGQLLQGAMVNSEYKVIGKDEWLEHKRIPTLVVSTDGLWMCFRRKLFDVIRWDDISFKGFHGYDTDISLQVWKAGYEVHIFWDVLIEHMSAGNAQLDFYRSLDVLYKKWRNMLPMIKGAEMSEGEQTARLRIAELRHELFYSEYKLRSVCASRQYRWGMYLLRPSTAYYSLMNHLKKLF